MTVRVVHPFVSAIPDSSDTSIVRPSDWNADHTIEGLGTAAEADTGDFATAAQGAAADTAVQPGDLASVATSGAYADLSGLPTLGTAAAADTGDFAAASHTHTASQVTDFSTAADARITAAIGSTVQAYAFVRIEDFGAVGDGSTDNTASIQAAIDSVNSGEKITLYAGPGDFQIDTDVSYNGRIVSFVLDVATTFSGAGKIGDYANRLPLRIHDRVFIGRQLDENDGGEFFTIVDKDWLETEVGSTSSTDSLVVLSPTGYGAIMGGSRTSDNPLASSEGTRGIGGIVVADQIGDFSAYAVYSEARRYGGAGWAHAGEFDIISRPGVESGSEAVTTPQLTPYDPFAAQALTGPWISVGRPDITDCEDASVGYALVNNAGARSGTAGRVKVGVLVGANVIRADDGTSDGSDYGDAMAMGQRHRVGWWNSNSNAKPSAWITSKATVEDAMFIEFDDSAITLNQATDGAPLFQAEKRTDADGYVRLIPGTVADPAVTLKAGSASGNRNMEIGSKGGVTFLMNGASGDVPAFAAYSTDGHGNYIQATANAAGGFAPYLEALGADTNIDLGLHAKGTGNVTTPDGFRSAHATKGIGYATGAGGAVTQATSKATGVTLNKVSGQITTHNASLAAAAEVSFTVTNSAVAATDVVVACIASGATAGAYNVQVDAVAAGSFRIGISNLSTGSLGEALVINFVVIKGVAA